MKNKLLSVDDWRKTHCGQCHAKYSDSLEHHIVHKHNVCKSCYLKNTKPYSLQKIEDCGGDCGGITIYSIKSASYCRLHKLIHYEYSQLGIRKNEDFHSINTWEEVWSADTWTRDCDKFNFKKSHKKGKLKRGLLSTDGNGLIAFVEDEKGLLWYIHGVWG